MKFNFDAVFLDNDLRIVYLIESMQPFKISPVVHEAQMVLEIPEGTISKGRATVGDQIVFHGKT
jgi:hypothetical protein